MEKMRPFQIGLLTGFALIALLSLTVLASFRGFVSGVINPYGDSVVVWGTLDSAVMNNVIAQIAENDENFSVISYFEIDPRFFEEELINAIADGRSPDAIILSHEGLVTYRNKLLPIPYNSISLRQIRDTYIDGADVFALQDGLYALPMLVDPMVMYWNRSLLASSGQVNPPTTWESLTDMVQEVTLRDATRNLLISAIAFGEYDNVTHAKEMLLNLALQAGSRMVEESEDGYLVNINISRGEAGRQPLNSALQFFLEFSNVNSPLYSWSKAQSSDWNAFLAEELALYFGYGSEVSRLSAGNPNFDFDIAPVPQGSGATIKQVYGKFYGIGLLKASPNPQGAYAAMLKLSSAEVTNVIAESLVLAPVHRVSLVANHGNPYLENIYDQALIAEGWLDPDPDITEQIFSAMVSDVISNRLKLTEAVTDAVDRLELAF